MQPFLEPLALVTGALDRLRIPYFVGGSIASILHGEIRTTQDADVVVEIAEPDVEPLAAALTPTFFVDRDAVRDAVHRRSSCNLIHRATAFKVDLFVRRERPFSFEEMSRRRQVKVAGVQLTVASAEDCVLAKLEWYEKADRVSDRQWRDVLGILKAQGASLDRAYLQTWATELGVTETLELALQQAGMPPTR